MSADRSSYVLTELFAVYGKSDPIMVPMPRYKSFYAHLREKNSPRTLRSGSESYAAFLQRFKSQAPARRKTNAA